MARNAGCGAGDVPPRVAASVLFLGLAAQLVAPLLGAAVLAGELPRLTVADLYWQPVTGGPWPLAARAPCTSRPSVNCPPGRRPGCWWCGWTA